jgi:hypothetical protein
VFIDERDEVFTRLRLWCDVNHNGQSELEELRSLPAADIRAIYLGFRNLLRKVDASGNIWLIDGTFYLQHGIEKGQQMVEVEFARGG